MNSKNRRIRSRVHGLLISCLGILVVSLCTGSAQADSIDLIDPGITGSISLPATSVSINGTNLKHSTIITPGGVTAQDGKGDFSVVPNGTSDTSSALNLTNLMAYTFTISGFGSWMTTSGTFDFTPNGKHLTVDLEGTFTPTFGGFSSSPGEIAISVNQSGHALSWAETMTDTAVPEPATMGLMALGILVGIGLLGRRKLALRSR